MLIRQNATIGSYANTTVGSYDGQYPPSGGLEGQRGRTSLFPIIFALCFYDLPSKASSPPTSSIGLYNNSTKFLIPKNNCLCVIADFTLE